jgi:hypothetical protein
MKMDTTDNPAFGFGTIDFSEGFEPESQESEPNQKPIPEITFREKFNVWFDYIGERVPLLNFL